MADLPTVITAAGLQPQSPIDLRTQLLALVAATNPGYTADLPGSLIEDILSTDVAAISLIDSARVEFVNSLSPLFSNPFLLSQLGQMVGVQIGLPSNTSVNCVFSGTPGFVISVGFTVSDGTYQYVVQDGGIIGVSAASSPLFCLASLPGSWAIPAGTVNQVITSVPAGVAVTVSNPEAGIPSQAGESEESYRSRVLQAGLAASQGMPSYLKTLVKNVTGVQSRLVSVVQVPNNGGWKIIVGGGDQYEVGFAILESLFDISSLVGSALSVVGVTNANPAEVTTNLRHGFLTGQIVQIAGVAGMSGAANGTFTITVDSDTSFTIPVNTISSGAYGGGGVVTPNLRNVVVSINNYPDTYLITFVVPPAQTVAMTVTWNTSSTNFVSPDTVATLGIPALVDYVNSIPVGVPMNLYELQSVFQAAISSVIQPQLLTKMQFAISFDGGGVGPSPGTGIIAGDPESFFLTNTGLVSVAQG